MSEGRPTIVASGDGVPSLSPRETALKEILQAISRSRSDEGPVFETILENAARLCDAPVVWLVLVDSLRQNFINVAFSGETQSFQLGEVFRLEPPSLIATSILEARTVNVANLADTEGYRIGGEQFARLVEQEGFRSRLYVPLLKNGMAIGCILLSRLEVRPFSEEETALIETFAEQAIIAIENVQHFRQMQNRLQREAAMREVLATINRSRDDEKPVIDIILEHAARLCDVPTSLLLLADDERHSFYLAGLWGDWSDPMNAGASWPMDSPLPVAEALNTAKTVHTESLRESAAYLAGEPTYVYLVEEEGLNSRLCVPLIRDGIAFGVIVLSRHELRPFDSEEIALIETFAEQAVIAFENVRQFKALQDHSAEIEALNAGLENKVATQVGEIERMGRLKRFLSPAVADAVISAGDEGLLSSHRTLVAALFADIRGFTAFCEVAEPEETIDVLQAYHEAMGALMAEHNVGVDHRWGDGIMAIYNDPIPCDDPAGDAVRLAIAMRDRMQDLCKDWKRLGHSLGFGIGISFGYATVGLVGSEGRYDYTASGSTINLASRLCDEAADGEILLSPRAALAVEGQFTTNHHATKTFKGIQTPVEVHCLVNG